MIRRWFILGILVLVMVSLLWNFYREVVVYHAMDAVKETQAEAKRAPKQAPQYSPAWDEGIINNNLFGKSRNYIAKQAPIIDEGEVETPAVELVPPDLNLNGIILDQYGEFVAFIQEGQGKPKRARKGDEIAGALVVDITAREVKLLWNDEEITLSMKKIQTVPRKR
jgi:hypothetical protein